MSYQTEQKRALLTFLEQHAEQAYSIDEIVHALKQDYPTAPGKSTVYRLMTHLVEEGAVKRFVKGNSRHFAYQLLRGRSCHAHLHLKCLQCGGLLHLDEETSHHLLAEVAHAKQFSVSERDTVLFGTCLRCAEAHHG